MYGLILFDLIRKNPIYILGSKEQGEIYQGCVYMKGRMRKKLISSHISDSHYSEKKQDPLVIAWVYKKGKFCIFSKNELKFKDKERKV